MKQRNILVVGGAGYLGGAITDYYLKEHKNKINLYVYDILLYEESYRKNINFIYGDIRDTEYLLKICKLYEIDIVIWLAAIVGDQACNINMLFTREINFECLKRFKHEFKGKICFTSTASVYGVQKDENLLDENGEINPVSLYASTKLECENILKDENAIIFRMGTLFGISDNHSRIRFDLVINKLALNAVRDKQLIIFGGKQYRPFLHVKDAARIIFDSCFMDKTGIFNICFKNEKIENLIPLYKNYFDELKIITQPMDFIDTRNYKIDTEKAKQELYFSPDFDIEYGISSLRKLLVEKRIKNFDNIRYSNYSFLNNWII